MFTGLIEALGTLHAVENQGQERLVRIRCGLDMDAITVGDSIAVNGVCLTVTHKETLAKHTGIFAAQVSAETLRHTTLAKLTVGAVVNLERALAYGGRLNGHLVQGHVDGTGQVERQIPRGNSLETWFRVPRAMGRYIMAKGSIAVEGVSLTVNTVTDAGGMTRFSINIIPHTQKKTTLTNMVAGQDVNIETDLLGRTVERLLTQGTGCTPPRGGIDEAYLREKGF